MFLEKVDLSQAFNQVLWRDSDTSCGLLLIGFWVLFLIVDEVDKGINFGHFLRNSPSLYALDVKGRGAILTLPPHGCFVVCLNQFRHNQIVFRLLRVRFGNLSPLMEGIDSTVGTDREIPTGEAFL